VIYRLIVCIAALQRIARSLMEHLMVACQGHCGGGWLWTCEILEISPECAWKNTTMHTFSGRNSYRLLMASGCVAAPCEWPRDFRSNRLLGQSRIRDSTGASIVSLYCLRYSRNQLYFSPACSRYFPVFSFLNSSRSSMLGDGE
jgi:hypothetical protein